MIRSLAVVALLTVSSSAQSDSPLRADPPIACAQCDAWNAPQEPFKVFGNTYYVGTAGLGAVLITSDAGHILIDGGLPQSAPVIDAHIRQLGFRRRDIRIILNSHPHFDHAGGIRALQWATGARVYASPQSAKALQQGVATADDPQAAFGDKYPAVRSVRLLSDRSTIFVENRIKLTAHLTPGHSPGGTTWSWRSCEGRRCLDIVYADSLTAVSHDAFKFSGDATHPSIVESFRRSIAVVEKLPCDVLLSVHPDFSRLGEKLTRRAAGDADWMIDREGCRAYAADATRRLDERVAAEKK